MEESIFSSDFANLAEQKKLVIEKIRNFVLGGKPYDNIPLIMPLLSGEEQLDEILDPAFVSIITGSDSDGTYPEPTTHVLSCVTAAHVLELEFMGFYGDSYNKPLSDYVITLYGDDLLGFSLDELLEIGRKVEKYVNEFLLAE